MIREAYAYLRRTDPSATDWLKGLCPSYSGELNTRTDFQSLSRSTPYKIQSGNNLVLTLMISLAALCVRIFGIMTKHQEHGNYDLPNPFNESHWQG